MTKKQMQYRIKLAQQNVRIAIRNYIDGSISKFYASGLASEGYNGGYSDALSDMQLLLNNVIPQRNEWWKDNAKDKSAGKDPIKEKQANTPQG